MEKTATPPSPRRSADAAGGLRRLLIPLDATAESRWGLHYARRLAEAGAGVEVCLLYLAAPVRNWEVLRFYTEAEVRRHFRERSQIFLEAAASTLGEAGIPCRTYFREADPVAGVIAMAEELACTEIVVPRRQCLWLLPAGLGRELLGRRCPVPVTRVDAAGRPAA